MRIVRYNEPTGDTAHYGLIEDDTVVRLEGPPYAGIRPTQIRHPLSSVGLLAPCEPTKVVAGGLNYHGHALEIGLPLPTVPVFFMKPPTTVIGPGASVVYPPETKQLEYEGELGVVVGHTMRNLSPEEVPAHVLGYVCIDDVTARDIQVWGNNFLHLCHSKSFDTFCPTGPWIETELDPGALDLTLSVNGEVRQKTNTSDMIFSVAQMLSYFSHVMTLLPGDLVLTGTPEGIGGMDVGDTVTVTIEGIGTLEHGIVAKA